MKKILCLLVCLILFLPAVSVADECEIRCEYCYAEIVNGDEGWMRVTYVEPGTTVYLYCDNSVVPEGKYFTGEYECILNNPQIDYLFYHAGWPFSCPGQTARPQVCHR